MNNKKTTETTLTHLTKRFVRLLNSNSDRVINLNDASTRLSVAKRRIYDITNVLEGIGLLQKTSKNVTRWVDCPKESPYAANQSIKQEPVSPDNPAIGNVELADLGIKLSGPPDAELLALVRTYRKLDEGVQELIQSTRHQMSVEGAYVTYHDFKSSFHDQTVIAVKGTPQTWLEVDENKQIAVRSEPGQTVEVYLCQADNQISQQQQQQQQPQQPQTYTSVSSDEGRGRSTLTTADEGRSVMSTTETDHFNDPTLSSALASFSEDDDPFIPLVPFDGREEPHYNFVLNEDFPIASLFPEDNLGLI